MLDPDKPRELLNKVSDTSNYGRNFILWNIFALLYKWHYEWREKEEKNQDCHVRAK